MRIRDWSSDVCSSDLWSDELGADAAIFCPTDHRLDIAANRQSDNQPFAFADHRLRPRHQAKARNIDDVNIARSGMTGKGRPEIDQIPSSSTQMSTEERHVGKEWVGKSRYRWST